MLNHKIFTYFAFQSTFIMSDKDYLKDISNIKNLMEKSSSYLALSGLSSVYTGVYCIIGATYFYYYKIETNNYSPTTAITVFVIATALSLLTTIFFTQKRAKKIKEKAWSKTTLQLISTFSITFIIGSIFMLVLAFQEKYIEIIPLVPLVYGLSLIHASKHTKNILKPLGIIQIVIAFLCLLFIELSFWFYVIGFGVAHLINGLIIHYKYDKK